MRDSPDSRQGQVHDTTEDGRGRSGNGKTIGKPCTTLSTGRETNGLDGLTQSGRFSGPGFDEGTKPLREYFAWTGSRIASELADTQNQLHVAACTGHISHETGIVTADVCRCMSTK